MQQLVCHKNCHFCVSSKCLCHTLRCHNMTQIRLCGGSTRPPPLAACCRSSMTLGSRGLCTPGVSRVVGREGKPAKIFTFLKSESCSTHLKFCWDAVEGGEKARGGAVYTVLGRTRWKTTSIWSATQIYLLLIFSPAFLKLIIDRYVLDS